MQLAKVVIASVLVIVAYAEGLPEGSDCLNIFLCDVLADLVVIPWMLCYN